jgi:hypothetical protein
MITYTSASRRRVAVLTSPSPELAKTCRSKTYYSRHTESHCDKVSKDQHTRAATIGNDDNHISEKTDVKLHQQTRKSIESQDIRQEHDSTPLSLD